MGEIRYEKVKLISETQERFHPGRILRGGKLPDGLYPFGIRCDSRVGDDVTSKGEAGADGKFLAGEHDIEGTTSGGYFGNPGAKCVEVRGPN